MGACEEFEMEFGPVGVDEDMAGWVGTTHYWAPASDDGDEPPPLIQALPFNHGFYVEPLDAHRVPEGAWAGLLEDRRLAKWCARSLESRTLAFASEQDAPVFAFLLPDATTREDFAKTMIVEELRDELLWSPRHDLDDAALNEGHTLFWARNHDIMAEGIDVYIDPEEQEAYFDVTRRMLRELDDLTEVTLPYEYVNIPHFFFGTSAHGNLVGVFTLGTYS